jgi:hypothetical protein
MARNNQDQPGSNENLEKVRNASKSRESEPDEPVS